MSLTQVVPELNKCCFYIDACAWYPWLHESAHMAESRLGIDSMAMFYIGGSVACKMPWYFLRTSETFLKQRLVLPKDRSCGKKETAVGLQMRQDLRMDLRCTPTMGIACQASLGFVTGAGRVKRLIRWTSGTKTRRPPSTVNFRTAVAGNTIRVRSGTPREYLGQTSSLEAKSTEPRRVVGGPS